MQVYLVGGAVRDSVLGRQVSEHDYVVVGATPAQMQALGFVQVGADFPVFLHPHTHDEYALARTERKSGNGYLGFNVHADPSVTLEEDLKRRDLTINAMAIEVNGLFDNTFKKGNFDIAHIIDPYHGLNDIEDKKLRHVSLAFTEDPVRVLRLARFASRYTPLGFSIADDTIDLVRQMREAGELDHLVAERIWAETAKALSQPHADLYFESLYQMGVLDSIMPSFAIGFEAAKHEDTWLKNLASNWQMIANALRLAHTSADARLLKFGLLSLVFLRLDTQQPHQLLFDQFCQTLKVPKQYQQVGDFILTHFDSLYQFDTLSATALFELYQQSNALKDTQKLQLGLSMMQVFKLAKQSLLVEKTTQLLSDISIKEIDQQLLPTLRGKAIGEAIDTLRLQQLTNLLNQH